MKCCGKCAARLDVPMSKIRILITTTSFQDTPGRHHDLLAGESYDIERVHGPLPESALLALVGDYDAILCGDDAFTRPVLHQCLPRLQMLSTYGIGVDTVDLQAATELRIPVTFCPGGNHVTVAEHTFGLLLALTRQMPQHDAIVKRGAWQRGVGRELASKTLRLLGLGRIGRAVAQRAVAFDMRVCAYDVTWDEAFAQQGGIIRQPTAAEVLRQADVVSLHLHLSDANRVYINAARLALMKPGAYLVNCARGGLINEGEVAVALACGQLAGYGADVVEPQPVVPTNPLLRTPNV